MPKNQKKKIIVNNRPNYIPLKRVKTIYKKLGRERAAAQTFEDDGIYIIEVDERQTAKELIGTYIHEICHDIFPDFSEKDIIKIEKTIGNYLWSLGYRKVDLK